MDLLGYLLVALFVGVVLKAWHSYLVERRSKHHTTWRHWNR